MPAAKIAFGAILGLDRDVLVGWVIAVVVISLTGAEDDPALGLQRWCRGAFVALGLAVVLGPIIGTYAAARLTRSDDSERRSHDLW